MSNTLLLTQLQTLTGSNNTDVLNELLDRVIEEATEYTRCEDIEEVIPSTILSMAVIHVNKLKSEGLTSEGYSGVSFAYSIDYPDSIMRVLKSNRHIGVI